MISENNVLNTIEKFSGTGKSFAEFIADLFKNKIIEIYMGDSYEEISLEQTSMSYPAVFCGKVIGAYKECLILNCAYVSKNSKKSSNPKCGVGNLLFINERGIRAINEVDNKGILEEMLLRSSETSLIPNFFK